MNMEPIPARVFSRLFSQLWKQHTAGVINLDRNEKKELIDGEENVSRTTFSVDGVPLLVEVWKNGKPREYFHNAKAKWDFNHKAPIDIILPVKRTIKRNPVAQPSSLVGIGKFIALQYDNAKGETIEVKPGRGERAWLAWRGQPDNGDMLVVDVAGREAARGDDETAVIHKNFHGEPPVNWSRVVWHPPGRAVRRLGLIRTITYRVPSRMPSNKNDADYIHAFGDFGGGVDMREQSKYWPALGEGTDGSLYIIRRSHNKYRLADWLEG